VALTVGDWDFWTDWKDRQWWPLVTPLMIITFPAAVQAVLWTNFRLPLGATLCISCLLIGTWIARFFAYHLWNYFPINEVLPATMFAGRRTDLLAPLHERRAHRIFPYSRCSAATASAFLPAYQAGQQAECTQACPVLSIP
jgi:Ammonia monooxygenase